MPPVMTTDPPAPPAPPTPPLGPSPPLPPFPPSPARMPAGVGVGVGVAVGVAVGVGVGVGIGVAVGVGVAVGRTITAPPPQGCTQTEVTTVVVGHGRVEADADTHCVPATTYAGQVTGEPAGTVHVPVVVCVTVQTTGTLQTGVGLGLAGAGPTAPPHALTHWRPVTRTVVQPEGEATCR